MDQRSRADHFRRLHTGGILVLANAWDAGSARALEVAGCPAIGTTSAGVAWSLGLADGERVGRDEMLAVVRRIAAAVGVPVSADVEAGYGVEPEAVAATVGGAIADGAVGVNLEDAPVDGPDLFETAMQCARLRAARAAANAAGVPAVLNARTDVFLRAVGEPETRVGAAVARLKAYRAAGADCLFAPGVGDAATIAALVRGVNGPLNVMVGPGAPPIAELERLGVARASLGGSLALAVLGLVRRAGEELLGRGSYGALAGGPSYGEVTGWFPAKRRSSVAPGDSAAAGAR